MTAIGGYVNLSISDQYVQCLACDEDVRVERIDNLTDIDPTSYGIVLYAEQCECGFKTVLEYSCDVSYSHRLSVEESGEDKWMARAGGWSIVKIEEEE